MELLEREQFLGELDAIGFNNYLNNIAQGGDWTGKVRQVVFDFIYSTEYGGRFGKP